ncbi:hypothetical protein PLICRDRAFT_32940 [Plicaturopsis crispa FD-325 SS-3]|uniref:Uncharacterized protein n=1 Tax=Plicaturopsis crispa FD-325 SS-3 TaxID=944288 RepID=A0A0C9T5I8_PLICR|nr:hypothetical protein PLICRDRAFT_32940 [Plicaturopsis crispa FD-325 SS-3]
MSTLTTCADILFNFLSLLVAGPYPAAMSDSSTSTPPSETTRTKTPARPAWARIVGGSGRKDATQNDDGTNAFIAEAPVESVTVSDLAAEPSAHRHHAPESPESIFASPCTPLKRTSELPLVNPWSPSPSSSFSFSGPNASLVTDTSSVMDETFPTFSPFSSANRTMQSDTSAGEGSSMLTGLGITGVCGDGSFDGLGLGLVSKFADLSMDREHAEDGCGNLSQTFLEEAVFTFKSMERESREKSARADGDEREEEDAAELSGTSLDGAFSPTHDASTPNRPKVIHDNIFFASPRSHPSPIGMRRDASMPTISSSLKRFSLIEGGQRGKQPVHAWKL